MKNVGTTSRLGENGRKMGGKWQKNGKKYPFLTVPFPPIFLAAENLSHSLFLKMNSPHFTDGKLEFLPLTDTNRHGG